MPTSKCEKGGAFTFERLKRNARNTLLQNPNAILSTFIDLYALDTDFPGFEESKKQADVYQRVAFLEKALHETIINYAACRKERFIREKCHCENLILKPRINTNGHECSGVSEVLKKQVSLYIYLATIPIYSCPFESIRG